MSSRQFELRQNTTIVCCPKCGNNTKFTAHSQRACEDSCDIWVVCQCGYDPTQDNTLNRLEDTWGGLDNGILHDALTYAWNEVIQEGLDNEP